ncbi:MAG: hypothetical protein Kow0096_11570 [Thiohalomonadaceae bacterium]
MALPKEGLNKSILRPAHGVAQRWVRSRVTAATFHMYKAGPVASAPATGLSAPCRGRRPAHDIAQRWGQSWATAATFHMYKAGPVASAPATGLSAPCRGRDFSDHANRKV